MAFLFEGLVAEGYRVVGTRTGVSKKSGNMWISISVVDGSGRTNEVSTTDQYHINVAQTLRFGDVVDMKLTVAGGPKSQYVMLSRDQDSLQIVQRAGVQQQVDPVTGEVAY